MRKGTVTFVAVCVWSIMLYYILQAIRKERFEKAIESEVPTRKSMNADDIQVFLARKKNYNDTFYELDHACWTALH
jgi:hypothetical protein